MKHPDKQSFDTANVFGTGAPNDAFAPYFIGLSYLQGLTEPTDQVPLSLANISFEPGCRNNWHRHDAATGGGQVLICTAGEGWYQDEGEDPVELTEGTVVVVPPNTKHWHGAKADSWFSHIAFILPGTEQSSVWLEPVDDEQYGRLAD